jgi:thiol-disulfide isomerase/thioredoxin
MEMLMASAAFVAVILGFDPVAQAPPLQSPALVYPPSDPTREISAAIASARKSGKYVLLDFGADWCPDCRVLGRLLEDASIAPFLDQNFHVVRIDVGRRDRNADVVAKYQATAADWIPALVILDADATVVGRTDDTLRLTRRTTSQELLALLKAWAPKARELELASFTERGVHVTLSLDRDSSGGQWLAGRFAPVPPDTHLYATDLPLTGVEGLGRPTLMTITSAVGLRVRGPVAVDRPVYEDRIEELQTTLRVYPAGGVTLRIPVELDPNAGAKAVVSVSYMGCSPRGCLPPVIDKRLEVVVRADAKSR